VRVITNTVAVSHLRNVVPSGARDLGVSLRQR